MLRYSLQNHIAIVVAAAFTATAINTAHSASSFQVKVENKCASPVPFVIQKKGNSLNTSLPPRTSATHSLEAGDRISVGRALVHTVSSASTKQPVIVCKK
jgi:hypothetical protein